jgi:hypothetical protein
MNCNSRHSFSLYYKRLCSQIGMWIVILSGMLNVAFEERTPDAKTGWKKFRNLISRLLTDKQRGSALSDSLISGFQFALVILGSCRMGLGP